MTKTLSYVRRKRQAELDIAVNLGLARSYEEEAGPAPQEFVFVDEFLAGGAEGISGRSRLKGFVECGGEIFGE